MERIPQASFRYHASSAVRPHQRHDDIQGEVRRKCAPVGVSRDGHITGYHAECNAGRGEPVLTACAQTFVTVYKCACSPFSKFCAADYCPATTDCLILRLAKKIAARTGTAQCVNDRTNLLRVSVQSQEDPLRRGEVARPSAP